MTFVLNLPRRLLPNKHILPMCNEIERTVASGTNNYSLVSFNTRFRDLLWLTKPFIERSLGVDVNPGHVIGVVSDGDTTLDIPSIISVEKFYYTVIVPLDPASRKARCIYSGEGLCTIPSGWRISAVLVYSTDKKPQLTSKTQLVVMELPPHIFSKDVLTNVAESIRQKATECSDPLVSNTRTVYNPPGTFPLLESLKPFVEEEVSEILYPVCTFGRIGSFKADMQAHVDRVGLDWTVSVVLTADREWPLEILEEGGWRPLSLKVGEATLIPGRMLRHRKTKFEGGEHITLLLHYSRSKERMLDKAPDLPKFVRLEGVLSPKDIKKIYEDLDETSLARGTVSHDNVISPMRTNYKMWLSRSTFSWLYEIVEKVMEEVNDKDFGFDISNKKEGIQLVRYKEGEFYEWHEDYRYREKGGAGRRTLSMSLLLRKAKKGGELEIKDVGVVSLNEGDAAIFPSGSTHRATPPVKGTRDALTFWCSKKTYERRLST